MSIFEVLMLVCFGLSWPVSVAKSLSTRKVTGKSPLFMGIVILGYLCGVAHKIFFSFDWVIWLYVFNLAMVALDLGVYFYLVRQKT